jgi:hypothetical protein
MGLAWEGGTNHGAREYEGFNEVFIHIEYGVTVWQKRTDSVM